jgi:hypothetical protein
MNWSARSIFPSIKNLTDCWWQIPPIGKDFQGFSRSKSKDFPQLSDFFEIGTVLV